jgi:hypothetical protein
MVNSLGKYKSGWRLLLIKAIITIVILALVEFILGTISAKDPMSTALKPFHNNYFSCAPYYLTNPGMGSEFSESPSATTRFVIFFILGYIMFFIINIIWFIPLFRPLAKYVNLLLFNLILIGAFLLAFFFPPKTTEISTIDKEIRITRHSWLFIPKTIPIHFSDIDSIWPQITSVFDGTTMQYINYLSISITTNKGFKIPLGKIQVSAQPGHPSKPPAPNVPADKMELAREIIRRMKAIIL